MTEPSNREEGLSQLTWLLPWMSGPVGPAVMLFQARNNKPGQLYRHAKRSLIFWSILLFFYAVVIVAEIVRGDGSPSALFLIAWGIFVVTAIATTAIHIWLIRSGRQI